MRVGEDVVCCAGFFVGPTPADTEAQKVPQMEFLIVPEADRNRNGE